MGRMFESNAVSYKSQLGPTKSGASSMTSLKDTGTDQAHFRGRILFFVTPADPC